MREMLPYLSNLPLTASKSVLAWSGQRCYVLRLLGLDSMRVKSGRDTLTSKGTSFRVISGNFALMFHLNYLGS